MNENNSALSWMSSSELGRQVALQQMKEDFGILAPLVRLFDRSRAWWLRLTSSV